MKGVDSQEIKWERGRFQGNQGERGSMPGNQGGEGELSRESRENG